MSAILAAVGFALVFLAAMAGWGYLLTGSLPRRRSADDGTEAASLGLSAWIAVGGLLNLLELVRPPVLIALLGTGLALAFWRFRADPFPPSARGLFETARSRAGAGLLIVAAAMIALRLAAAGVSRSFSPYDDFTAYFVFPTRLAQTGSLGLDPFSARRSLSALGGSYFLDATVLTFFDHRSLNLMDKGVGLLLLAGSLLAFARERACPPALAALPLALLAVVPPLGSNVTSLLLSAALFVALVRRLSAIRSPVPTTAECLRLALLAAALSSLKSTMIPFAVLLLGFWWLPATRQAPAAALRRAACLAGATFVLLLPWMLSMHASAGTLLYPLLGQGHYGFPPVSGVSTVALVLTFVVGAATLALGPPFAHLCRRRGESESFRRAGISAIGAAGAGTLVLVLGTTGMGFLRQPFPVLFALSLLTVATALGALPDEKSPTWRRGLLGIVGLILLAGVAGVVHRPRLAAVWVRDLTFALSAQPLEPPGTAEEMARLQGSIPPGAPVLAFLPRPYLFDFRRNPIAIADYPGTFAPPPGLPLDREPEALRRYLFAQGIAFVAFTLEPHPKLEREEQYPWMQLAVRHQLAFERQVLELAERCEKPFDAGATFVVALARCAPP